MLLFAHILLTFPYLTIKTANTMQQGEQCEFYLLDLMQPLPLNQEVTLILVPERIRIMVRVNAKDLAHFSESAFGQYRTKVKDLMVAFATGGVFPSGATRNLSRASRSLSGRVDRYNSGFFIKHKRELTTLPVLLYDSGHRKGRLKFLYLSR